MLAQAHSRSDELAALGAGLDNAGRQPIPASRFLPIIQALDAAQRSLRGPEPAPALYQQIGIRG